MATELDALPQDFYEAIHEIACNVGTEEYAPVVRDYCERLAARVQELERERKEHAEWRDINERARFDQQQRAERAEAELAAIKKRIADAQTAEVFEGMSGRGMVTSTGGLPRDWIGKRVALLPLDDEAKS